MAYKITKAVNDMQNKHIKITIHAGAHKTATTHLQNRLLENENLFANYKNFISIGKTYTFFFI